LVNSGDILTLLEQPDGDIRSDRADAAAGEIALIIDFG